MKEYTLTSKNILNSRRLRNTYDQTWYSFSPYDIQAAFENELRAFRGFDEVYQYEMEGLPELDNKEIKGLVNLFKSEARNAVLNEFYLRDEVMDDDYEYHLINEYMAKKYGYKYARSKRK